MGLYALPVRQFHAAQIIVPTGENKQGISTAHMEMPRDRLDMMLDNFNIDSR